MAKFETVVNGNIHQFLDYLEENLSFLGTSVSLEDSSVYSFSGVDIGVYVLERYSYMGGNRLSLNLTITGDQHSSQITAITAGGSQAVFFKINTIGEDNFLQRFIDLVNQYE